MTAPYTAVIIRLPDDDGVVKVEKVTSPEGDQASLHFLQEAVGGYIEHLDTPPEAEFSIDFWFNEEGKLHGLPINTAATELLWLHYPAFRNHDVLVGNVVLTGHRGPETTSVVEGLWEHLTELPWTGRVEFVEEGHQWR